MCFHFRGVRKVTIQESITEPAEFAFYKEDLCAGELVQVQMMSLLMIYEWFSPLPMPNFCRYHDLPFFMLMD